MKKITAIFLLIFSFTYSSAIYAGAAEKWDYEVKPDTNQKLDIKGHKVDQYGSAANDYEYKRKIDPHTAANRSKMGIVGMGRLLKITGWGILGNAALQGLLEAVDWVIDPETQSIWRNKKTPDSFSCSYTYVEGGKTYFYKFKGAFDLHFCPLEAAKSIIKQEEQGSPHYQQNSGKFIKWIVLDVDERTRFQYSVQFKPTVNDGKIIYSEVDLSKVRTKIEAPSPEKEVLTPEDLADYANHTHKDYSNPELAPKLNPKYSPNIQTDLWKPANPWEYDNSPTVDEVKKELEQAKPEPKDDKIKENEPDPETGAKSFSLPAFCSWATSVCEFIDWMKEKPEQEQEQDLPDIDDQDIFSKEFDYSFSLSNQCPPDIPLKFQTQLLSGNFNFSMKWLCIIFTALGYPIVFASHCLGVWILYETTTRKQIKW